MMRAIAALLIAGAAGLGLTGCNSVTGGHAVSTGSNPPASTGSVHDSVDSPVVGNGDANGETISLDDESTDTLLIQMYRLMGGGCAMTVKTHEDNVACADKVVGTTVTMHGTVTEKLGLPEDNYIMVSVGRDGRTGTFDAVCQDNLDPCMSVAPGDSVYIVTTLQDITQDGQSTLYTLGPSPLVQSITRQ